MSLSNAHVLQYVDKYNGKYNQLIIKKDKQGIKRIKH